MESIRGTSHIKPRRIRGETQTGALNPFSAFRLLHCSSYFFYSRHAGTPSLTSYHSRSNSHGASYEYQSHQVISPQLFDQDLPYQPNPHLMHQFIQLFFEHYGADYPFLSQEITYRHFADKRLQPVLANIIAAMACRYAEICLVSSPALISSVGITATLI